MNKPQPAEDGELSAEIWSLVEQAYHELTTIEVTDAIMVVLAKDRTALLDRLAGAARSYSITDLEMLQHQTGNDEVVVVPLSVIEKERGDR